LKNSKRLSIHVVLPALGVPLIVTTIGFSKEPYLACKSFNLSFLLFNFFNFSNNCCWPAKYISNFFLYSAIFTFLLKGSVTGLTIAS